MTKVYEYNGKVHVKHDNFTIETNEDLEYVQNNLQEYIDKIEKFKGEI